MTAQGFFEVAGYFANPIRDTRIEIEAKQSTISNYAPTYQTLTGIAFPATSDAITSLPNSADKRGREMRIYFACTNSAAIPSSISSAITIGGRHGYDNWDSRLNDATLIDRLFSHGFILGHPQDPALIRSKIPVANIADFDRGFNLP